MERIGIRLLGPPRIEVGRHPIEVRTRKELALLSYLAVGSRHRHRRESLVGLLWPDATDDAARNNLRVALATLRRRLGDAADALVANRQTVHLEAGDVASVDVTTYRRLIETTRSHEHASIERCDDCLAALTEAVEQYHGPFLQGLSLPGCAEFEDWLTVQREQLHRAQLSSLDTLADAAAIRGDHAARSEYGRRLLALEPWRESAHAHIIGALVALGERGEAIAQYDTCRRVLHDELGLAPSAELEALVDQLRSSSEVVFDPTMPHRHPGDSGSRGMTRGLRRLDPPALLTPLVGRDDELAAVGRLLDGPDRLVTVIGPGGVGKTSLVQAAGRERARADYGVCWVPLAGVDTSDDPTSERRTLVDVIATAFGHVLSGKGDPVAELVEVIGEGRSLLLLDNCEHLPRIGPLVRSLLEGSPGLQVLATSREPLGLSGERLIRLQGLAVPPAGAHDASEYTSVQLFLDRAARRSSHWATDGADAAVARLCRIVDGLPLAIELAAGWIGHFSVEEIAAQVQTDIDFLAGQAGERPDRHSSLRAVFDYSWRALDPVAQRALARVSVLRAAFDRDTALEVADVSLTTLSGLVDKSLIRNVAPGRYSTHELVRQLAAEHLEADGTAAQWHARHAAVFLRFAERARPELGGAEQHQWLDRLQAVIDDLRAALAWAESRSDVELGLRLGAALWPFWQRRCWFAEGQAWLERFLAEDRGEVDPAVRADVLHGAGWLCHDQDDFDRAEEYFAAGLAIDEHLGRTDRVAWVMAHRGVMARDRGDYQRGVELLEASVATARSIDDAAGVAYGLFRLGVVSREHGNVERAAQASDEAVAIYRSLGDRVGEAFALLVKADIARDEGEPVALRHWSDASLEIGRVFDHSWVTGFSLNNLALAALMLGELDQADALAAEALALFRTHGVRGGEVEMLITKGRIELAAGHDEAGRATLIDGVRRGWEHGPRWLAATGVEELAGQFDDPRQTVRLLAAVDAWRTAMGTPLPPARRRSIEAMLARATDRIGQSAVSEAWAEGSTWSPHQAVDATTTAAASAV